MGRRPIEKPYRSIANMSQAHERSQNMVRALIDGGTAASRNLTNQQLLNIAINDTGSWDNETFEAVLVFSSLFAAAFAFEFSHLGKSFNTAMLIWIAPMKAFASADASSKLGIFSGA